MKNDNLKKLTIKEEPGLFFMQWRNDLYWHESKNAWHCSLYGDDLPIHKVMVTEDSENKSQYYAWFDNEKKDYSMIWPNRISVEICFPYGYRIEEKNGRGKFTCVNIEFVEIIKE